MAEGPRQKKGGLPVGGIRLLIAGLILGYAMAHLAHFLPRLFSLLSENR